MTTQVTAKHDKPAYFPNVRVRIIAGSNSGKEGVVGSAKPNHRNKGKTEVLVGHQNKSVWCEPEWLELKEEICSPNLISAQALEQDSPQLELSQADSSSPDFAKLTSSVATGC